MAQLQRTELSGHVTALFVVVSLSVAASCQKLDPNLTAGNVQSTTGGGGSGSGSGGSGSPDGSQGSCNTARMQARAVLLTNCSGCHQDPMKQMSINSGGPFSFVLELDKLTTETSPTFLGAHYVVQGDPSHSLIHLRYSGGGMPPASVAQRPSMADLAVMDDWITRCIGDPDSPGGWPPFSPSDAGTATDGGTALLPACGPANACPSGGCCVFNQCVSSGNACGPIANPTPGMQDLPGLPGMCTNGSCQKSGDGGGASVSCGKVGEPCCDLGLCTASQSSCLITDMTMCSQCGGTGEPCCKPNGCLDGRACVNGGVGRVGVCQLCGGLGQPCCGAGVTALLKCNGGLSCVSVSGMGNLCAADGGSNGNADGAATGG